VRGPVLSYSQRIRINETFEDKHRPTQKTYICVSSSYLWTEKAAIYATSAVKMYSVKINHSLSCSHRRVARACQSSRQSLTVCLPVEDGGSLLPCFTTIKLRVESFKNQESRHGVHCERSEHSFSKGCEIGPTKQSQILLALRLKEKFRCCVPPSSVNSGPLPLKMYILVDNLLLYVFVPKKRKDSTSNLVFGLVIYSPEKLLKRCVFCRAITPVSLFSAF